MLNVEKIKSSGLILKFCVGILITLLVMVMIVAYFLRSGLNHKFETPDKKGLFVAEALADQLEPLLKDQDPDSLDVQKNVQNSVLSYYRSVSGMFGVRYILIQNSAGAVIADTFKDMAPQWLVEKNPLSGKPHCAPWPYKDGIVYVDCAIPLKLSDEQIGAVRAGILEQNPQSPLFQRFKAEHVKGVFSSLFYWLSVVLVLLFTALLTVAFWFFVIRRIRFLSEATERMSFGDLETEVLVKSQDEIGILEDTLERMRTNLKDAIERLKRRK